MMKKKYGEKEEEEEEEEEEENTKLPLRRNICQGIIMWNMRLPGPGQIIYR